VSNLALKPIETKYRGYRFRSRLEARWAVFFDLLGLQWEYEPEGFKLPSGTVYLPDFKVYTPQGKEIWYEVKPGSVKDYSKFTEFKGALDRFDDDEEFLTARAALLSGDPMDMVKMKRERYAHYDTNICPRCGLIAGSTHFGEETDALDSLGFYGCQPCDHETPSGKGNSKERGVLGIEVEPYKGQLSVDDLNAERFAGLVLKAAQAARSARFEHGECG